MNYNGTKYVVSMLGGEIGLNEHILLYSVVPYVFLAMGLFIGLTSKDIKEKFSIYQTVIMLLIVVAIVGLIFTSLYIQWTRPQDEAIRGVQGRYFLPILPLVLLLLGKLKFHTDYSREGALKAMSIAILLTQIPTLLIIFSSNLS